MRDDIDDCAVLGGGPGGLTTALYLARLHRRVRLFDAGRSRAALIPRTHNLPGFPGGIAGSDFLARLRAQVGELGVPSEAREVEALDRDVDDFVLRADTQRWRARTVVIATGVRDVLPPIPGNDEALRRGALRLCPLCDGYESSDRRLVVLGPAASALDHAIFLRAYSGAVATAPLEAEEPRAEDRRRAAAANVELLPHAQLAWRDEGVALRFADGSTRHFDAAYPALGCHSHSDLATRLGAKRDANGDLVADTEQCIGVPGLYAVGDVVSAINQIAVALGHAAVAATAIHRALPPRWRERS